MSSQSPHFINLTQDEIAGMKRKQELAKAKEQFNQELLERRKTAKTTKERKQITAAIFDTASDFQTARNSIKTKKKRASTTRKP